jgi:hypothetical protein
MVSGCWPAIGYRRARSDGSEIAAEKSSPEGALAWVAQT